MLVSEALPVAPEIGTKWKHYNGTLYVVDDISNLESTKVEYPPTVFYRNLHTNSKWSRPLSDWHRSMTRIPDDDAPHKSRFKEGCNCGCNIPIADNPIQMLRFLAGRLEAAGVSPVVGETYARDIRAILSTHKEVL